VEFNGTAGYGTVRPVVWEDGGREPASYPIGNAAFNEAVGFVHNENPRRGEGAHDRFLLSVDVVVCPIDAQHSAEAAHEVRAAA
jgi:hypothetical protein